MEINVSKQELAGALTALGKLICRTSPVEAYRSVEIVGEENKITLRTANADESIAFCLAAEVAEPFAVLVNFDDFRTVVKCSRNKFLTVTLENGQFAVDGLPMPLVKDQLPPVVMPEHDCTGSALPPNFVHLLTTAAPIADRNNYRKILQGIHLCKEGIVVTNGKELLHIAADLQIDSLTLPFPLALLATKSSADGVIYTWLKEEYRYFYIELGSWCWSGKALAGTYPNWKQVIPEVSGLTNIVRFTDENSSKLLTFLKCVPDNPPNNPITLSQLNDTLKVEAENGQQINIDAEFPNAWNDFCIGVNKTLLIRLLSEGHLQLSCGEQLGPFIASLGIGTYVAMPLAFNNKTNIQPQNKEKENMNVNETNNPVAAAPVQPVTATITPVNQEPIAANPLDDLATAIDEFKGRIRLMFDEASNLTKKVREVAIAQKQKERDFIMAKRAIERIRMAI